MLQNGLSDNVMTEKFSVPYLLQMCSSSVPLLDVLMDSALPKREYSIESVTEIFNHVNHIKKIMLFGIFH